MGCKAHMYIAHQISLAVLLPVVNAHTAYEQSQQMSIDSEVHQVLRRMCIELLSSEPLEHHEMLCCAFEMHILIKDCLHALMQR
jgi:hypothetical protein